MRKLFPVFIVALGFLLTGCKTGSEKTNPEDNPNLIMLPVPSSIGSGEPNLFSADNGNIFLSWIEEVDGKYQLKFSKFSEGEWDAPKMITEGSNWFVNWADFPSLAVHKDGDMAAHFLKMNGEGTYAYGVNLVFSHNDGKTWSEPVIPHETETETEHGFVSLLPYESGYFAAWLDGRNTGGSHDSHDNSEHLGAMSIRAAFLDAQGGLIEEFELDNKTCDCCQTSAVITDKGPVVAYRDRSDEEIRDISVVRWTGEEWTDPLNVGADNWMIQGCPVNGPVLAANANTVALCWFTIPDQKPEVRLAFSENGGETFNDPVRIDLGNPIGRVDMKMLDDQSVYISWIEAEGEIGQIMVAHYSVDGTLTEQFVLTENRSDRASGFPRMGVNDEYIFMVWRDMMEEPSLKSALIKI